MTSTEPQERITAAVRALADAVVVTAPPAQELIERAAGGATVSLLRPGAARPRTRWLAPLATAAAVIAVVAGAVAIAPTTPTPVPPGSGPGAVLPSRLPELSPSTATESSQPSGPAAATYLQGIEGPRNTHSQQTLVMSIDGHSFRRLDEAEQRGAADDGGWQDAPVLLSPDGLRVAVGSRSNAHSVAIVDLRTGKTREYPTDRTGVVGLFAWSPDGSQLAYGVNPGSDATAATTVRLLDLNTEASSKLPFAATAVAFSPDGTRLVVQDVSSGVALPLRLVELNGGHSVTLASDGSFVQLAGPNAWSPDGRWVAVLNGAAGAEDSSGKPTGSSVEFVATDPQSATVPAPVVARNDSVALIGWRSPDRLLISSVDNSRDLYESTLSGQKRRLIRIPGDVSDLQIAHAQLVTTQS